MNKQQFEKSSYQGKIKETVKLAEKMRVDGANGNPMDVSFAEIVKDKFNVSFAEFLYDLGIDPTCDSVSNISTLDAVDDIRWIVPEIYREAIRLGINKSPIWPSITTGEQTIKGLKVIMPYINPADSAPRKVGEAETIPLGTLSYGQKEVGITKIGRGIKISYELQNYAAIDVVSIFLQDFGVKLGMAMDVLAIDTIINGDQLGGSDSASVIGIGTAGTKVYKDFLRVWVRMARLGRVPNVIIGGENSALDTLNLAEFKTNAFGGINAAGVPTAGNLDFQTPIPRKSSYFIHGNVPANQEIILDPTKSLLKLNAQPLLVESEKIVSNQTNAFYATLTTGFAKLFRDASIIMDSSIAFSGNGFPTYMDVNTYEDVVIED